MNKTNALVLWGGAARGLAHIGVIKNLEKQNTQIDLITGNSMGSLIGALLASGKTAEQMEQIVKDISWLKLWSLPSKWALISGNNILKWLKKEFGKQTQIEDLPIKFACIATDIDTGEEIIFNKGSLVDALRSSISIPGVFKPHQVNNRFLVDGFLVNNLPVKQAIKMGADNILAIKVLPDKEHPTIYQKYHTKTQPKLSFWKRNGVNVLKDLLAKSYYIVADELDRQQLSGLPKNVKLSFYNVPMGDISTMDFRKWEEIVGCGERVKVEGI